MIRAKTGRYCSRKEMAEAYGMIRFLIKKGWKQYEVAEAAGYRSGSAISFLLSNEGSKSGRMHIHYFDKLRHRAVAVGWEPNIIPKKAEPPEKVEAEVTTVEAKPREPVVAEVDDEDRAYLTLKGVRKSLYAEASKLEDAMVPGLPPYMVQALSGLRDSILGIIQTVDR